VTIDYLIADVFAWDVLFQLAGAVAIGVLFAYLGHRPTLLVCSGFSIVTVALTMYGHTDTVLLFSQACWGFSFTALFQVHNYLPLSQCLAPLPFIFYLTVLVNGWRIP